MKQDPRFQQIFSSLSGRHRRVPGLQSSNPVIRFLSGVVALLVFALMSFIGLMVFLLVLAVGIVVGGGLFLWRRITGRSGPVVMGVPPGSANRHSGAAGSRQHEVIDAEFTVIDRQQKRSD